MEETTGLLGEQSNHFQNVTPSSSSNRHKSTASSDDELLTLSSVSNNVSSRISTMPSIGDDDLLQLDDAVVYGSNTDGGSTQNYPQTSSTSNNNSNTNNPNGYLDILPGMDNLSISPANERPASQNDYRPNYLEIDGTPVQTVPPTQLEQPPPFQSTDSDNRPLYLEVDRTTAVVTNNDNNNHTDIYSPHTITNTNTNTTNNNNNNSFDAYPQPPEHGPTATIIPDSNLATTTTTTSTAMNSNGENIRCLENISDNRPITFSGGQLPDDFLTLMVPVEVPLVDPNLMGTGAAMGGDTLPESGMIQVFVHQARLAKNYGIGRMDPYVRITAGSYRVCSQICVNGAKTPFWDRRVQMNIPEIQDFTLKVEVLSQGIISDRLVGWTEIPILEAYQGKQLADWYPLTGKQGKDKEGVIHLTIAFQPARFAPARYVPNREQPQSLFQNLFDPQPPPPQPQPILQYPLQPQPQVAMQYPPQQPQLHQQPQPVDGLYPGPYVQPSSNANGTDANANSTPNTTNTNNVATNNVEDVKQLKDMFPAFDESILEGVLQSTQGDVGRAIETLLSMS